MFKRKSARGGEDRIAADIAEARSILPALRLRLDKGGASAATIFGRGVHEVATALASSLGRPRHDILSADSLPGAQITEAVKDLGLSAERCQRYRSSERESVRDEAIALEFACIVLQHLYRMRLHALGPPTPQREEAREIAETFANLARVLDELGKP